MQHMFQVRSARALAPSLQLGPLPVHTACAAAVLRTPASRLAPLPASHARLSTRQSADAFNQPLSFDTSSVTNMIRMFNVRSARALWPPSLRSGPPRACRLRRYRPTPSRLPARTSRPASHALLSTRQTADAFNQSLSFDTSSVTDMRQMFYVRSARALGPQP